MITEIQGLPPIVIEDFPELQNSVKKGIEESLLESSKLMEEKQAEDLKQKQPEEQKLSDFSGLSQRISDLMNDQDIMFQFSMDKSTKKMILKLIDSETKEVIQQYPPDIALKIARIVANSLEKGFVTNAKF